MLASSRANRSTRRRRVGSFLGGLLKTGLERLQPTPGYMRLVKDLVMRAWQDRKDDVGREADEGERRAKAIKQMWVPEILAHQFRKF